MVQLYHKKQIRLHQAGIEIVVGKQAILSRQLLIGQLKEDVRCLPVAKKCLFQIKGCIRVVLLNHLQKGIGAGTSNRADLVALVAQFTEQVDGSCSEVGCGELLQCVADCGFQVMVWHRLFLLLDHQPCNQLKVGTVGHPLLVVDQFSSTTGEEVTGGTAGKLGHNGLNRLLQ